MATAEAFNVVATYKRQFLNLVTACEGEASCQTVGLCPQRCFAASSKSVIVRQCLRVLELTVTHGRGHA